ARDLDFLQELLLGELLEERRLAAPEDVDLGLALPLDDAAVGHRRPRRDRARLHGEVPLLLRVVGERLERRVVDELRHRRDQRQLALDRRLPGGRAGRAARREYDRDNQHDEPLHLSSPLRGSAILWTSLPRAASHRTASPALIRPIPAPRDARGPSGCPPRRPGTRPPRRARPGTRRRARSSR